MDNFIYIDPKILGALLFIVLICLFGFVLMGCAYLKEARENVKSKQTNKNLRRSLSAAEAAYYKATFKVPCTDEDYEEKFPINELGGTKDV